MQLNNQSGLTVVEIIIAIVIMGVMFIFAIPNFTSTSHSNVKSAVRDVATEMQMARMRAIYKNLEHRVLFSTGSPFGYKLQIGNEASNSTTWTDAHTTAVLSDTSDECYTLSVSGYFCFKGVTVTESFSGISAQFNPVGTSSSGSVRFRNPYNSNDKFYISLSGATGRVNIVDCTKVNGDTICDAI